MADPLWKHPFVLLPADFTDAELEAALDVLLDEEPPRPSTAPSAEPEADRPPD